MSNPAHSSPLLPLEQAWYEIPLEEYYTPVTHKEKLAIKTMEAIPELLRDARLLQTEQAVSPTVYFSPAMLPLQDRMAVIFSRVLARARMEADNGKFTFGGVTDEVTAGTVVDTTATTNSTTAAQTSNEKKGLRPNDVMSALEAEAFLTNIEVVQAEINGVTKWFRRYYRVTALAAVRKEGIGAVRAATGKTLPSFVMPSIGQRMERHEEDERVIIADLEVGDDGVAVGGWWNDQLPEHGMAARFVATSRRNGKWAPIPLRLNNNSR